LLFLRADTGSVNAVEQLLQNDEQAFKT